MAESEQHIPLIVGAGPTGLLFSLWLQKFGVPHRIVDAAPNAGTTSRAMVVHARTLEFYRQLGIADDLLALGSKAEQLAFHYNGSPRLALAVSDVIGDLTKYPFPLVAAQNDHEAMLERVLLERGGKVERNVKVTYIQEREGNDSVEVALNVDGIEQNFTAAYVIGCDGAHSVVRHSMDTPMEGATNDRAFYVADVVASGAPLPAPNANFCFTNQDFGAVIPIPHQENAARLIGVVPRSVEEQKGDKVTFNDILPSVKVFAPHLVVGKVNWFSRYKVHHRTAQCFQKGRLFICGDAAHIHSPLGGQGMNTGLGDATNLAWKIAAVWKGAPVSLLDTYSAERMPFAKTLVETTDRAFGIVAGDGYASIFFRTVLLPYIMPIVYRLFNPASVIVQRLSQIGIEYRKSPMSVDSGNTLAKSRIQAGDRLPYISDASTSGEDNHEVLGLATWQCHVFGEMSKKCEGILDDRNIKLYQFPWTASVEKKGFQKDVFYLVRPDGYVGLVLGVAQNISSDILTGYLERWVCTTGQ